jgi:hypothetical protein
VASVINEKGFIHTIEGAKAVDEIVFQRFENELARGFQGLGWRSLMRGRRSTPSLRPSVWSLAE